MKKSTQSLPKRKKKGFSYHFNKALRHAKAYNAKTPALLALEATLETLQPNHHLN